MGEFCRKYGRSNNKALKGRNNTQRRLSGLRGYAITR